MTKPQYGGAHQARRKAWKAELRRLGTVPCGCGCGQPIRDGEPFDLGHGIAHTHGGDGTDSRPEIPGHNRGNGARIANERRRRQAKRDDWW